MELGKTYMELELLHDRVDRTGHRKKLVSEWTRRDCGESKVCIRVSYFPLGVHCMDEVIIKNRKDNIEKQGELEKK